MSTTLLFAVGCILFAVTTFASLWVGYLLLQRAWVNQNPELTSEEDSINPLFAKSYPQQRRLQSTERQRATRGA